MCIGGSKPSPPKAPKPVNPDSEAVIAAGEARRKQAALATGQGGTILTSGLGVGGNAPVAKKTLLGS